jgi:hypothetical protein
VHAPELQPTPRARDSDTTPALQQRLSCAPRPPLKHDPLESFQPNVSSSTPSDRLHSFHRQVGTFVRAAPPQYPDSAEHSQARGYCKISPLSTLKGGETVAIAQIQIRGDALPLPLDVNPPCFPGLGDAERKRGRLFAFPIFRSHRCHDQGDQVLRIERRSIQAIATPKLPMSTTPAGEVGDGTTGMGGGVGVGGGGVGVGVAVGVRVGVAVGVGVGVDVGVLVGVGVGVAVFVAVPVGVLVAVGVGVRSKLIEPVLNACEPKPLSHCPSLKPARCSIVSGVSSKL